MFSFVHSPRIAKILCWSISVLNKVKAIVCVCVGRWFNSMLGAKLPYGKQQERKKVEQIFPYVLTMVSIGRETKKSSGQS